MVELMDQDIAKLKLEDIVELKDSLLRVSTVAEEQNQCVLSLAEGEDMTQALSFGSCKGCIRVLLSTAGSTERMLFRLEKRIDDLRAGFDAHQQDLINHRLNLLTILSAVFLPLTLMAGIWGKLVSMSSRTQ